MSDRCELQIGDCINKYIINGILGKGAFSDVYSVCTEIKGKNLAIKAIKNKPILQRQSLKEISILNILKYSGKPWLPSLLDNFDFNGHTCLVFNIYGNNLYKVLKKRKRFKLNDNECLSVISQLSMALSHLEEVGIIHCDIKPENIMCKYGSDITHIILGDFGSSYYNEEAIVTTYIQTRFYRAPEIVLGIKFSYPIDVWSLGCIMYEIYFGHPLFGIDNSKALLKSMIEIMGLPPKYILEQSSEKVQNHYFYPSGGFKYLRTRPLSRKITEDLMESPVYYLLDKVLCWDPMKRIKPQEILEHPFISSDC